jgi:hypothetical protein
MFLGAPCKLFLLASLLYVSTAFSPITTAQEPIRVQTNQVLVPVFVFDKHRDQVVSNDPTDLLRAAREGNVQLERDIVEGIVIRDLTASDFQVFEDGKEQTIQNVTYEHSSFTFFRDANGYHDEFFGEGGGKWSSADWPPWLVAFPGPGKYLIAYSLPASAEGSCHQIKVSVDRPNALILARNEYCNIKDSVSDPLNGTILGKQMESYLALAKDSKIDLTLQAFAFYTDSGAERVYVAIDWPSQSLKRDLRAIRILGMVFKKDGSFAGRFSDHFNWPPVKSIYNHYDDRAMTRYERQLSLPPGEYDVRVVLNAGTKFGQTETPLIVQSHDRRELALSAVSLCKQVQDAFPYSSQNQPNLRIETAKSRRNYVPLVSKDVEFKPTGNTRFKKGATLYTYFEIYEPSVEGQSAATVQIQMRIVNLKTGEPLSDSQPISATPYVRAGSPVIPVGRGMDISKLPKGSYRLDVQASDSTGKSTAWRTASFTVE